MTDQDERNNWSEDSREHEAGRAAGGESVRHVNYHRKLWHFASGAVVVASLVLFAPSKMWAIVILATGLALMLVIDIVRYLSRRGKRLFWRHLGFLASEKEKKGPTTSLYYAASLLLCVIIFPPFAAIGGIISLAAGDSAAAIVGRRFGRLRIGGKSIEGGLANAVLTFALILMFVRSYPVAASGALVGAVVEMFSIPWLDDNITVPLAAGGAMVAAAALFGM